jgi:hypothetical protein
MTPKLRGSDVYLKEDIAALLESLVLTAQTLGGNTEHTRYYCEGIAAVAVALGIRSIPLDDAQLTRGDRR